ncbi:hypothetical protein E4M02_10970 [Brevundimonas sp. S30B]|uniref:hypothetical protein n=1 Tax=unclassified Brevundimonas TaxID=2622653 RepID=UPI0010726CCB|nr:MULTISPECIES: hypothetical protein [unclassified Brevundimonas]QBX38635.1 hypothetical protein E4M01_13230 [Brevundimonas sp. MF30-B]TFW01226.1 hypothetical protein E4M02_10970 [Brevundimonas sp. S30B]
MTTTPDTVVVPPQALEAIAHNLCSLHGFDPDFVMGQEKFARAVITEYLRAARPAATPGGEREDSAFKIASDLHAAYEQLIYGLPKYLEAENLTDEENMIREAYITLDVTAHRLAALSRPAPVAVSDAQFLHAMTCAAERQAEREEPGFWQDRARSHIARMKALPTDHEEVQKALTEARLFLSDLGYAAPTPEPAAARGGEDREETQGAATLWMKGRFGGDLSGDQFDWEDMQDAWRAGMAYAAPALSAKGGS